MSPDQDADDAAKVIAGDPEAFDGIVQRWQGPLVTLAYRFCRDRGRAEDMAQEAFLLAFRGLKQWRAESRFSTWLIAIAVNVYRSHLRRLPAAAAPLDDAGASAVRQISDDLERYRTVREAVLTLPTHYREALILFYFRDMDVAAAAQALGIPQGTLKARLSRARDFLRAKLPVLLDQPDLETVTT